MRTVSLVILTSLLTVAGASAQAAPVESAFETATGTVALRSDETGRWMVLAVDALDGKGTLDGHVDDMFFFHMSEASEPRLSMNFRLARVEYSADEVVLTAAEERRAFHFLMANKRTTHPPLSLPVKVFANGVQLNHRSGPVAGAIDIASFDVGKVVLPEEGRDVRGGGVWASVLARDSGDGGGASGCPSSCSVACRQGNGSATCSSRCALCSCSASDQPAGICE